MATDRLRSHRLWQHASDADAELALVADPSPGPVRIVEMRAEIDAIDRALQRLQLRHQLVLMALRVEELTRLEVARSHGISLRHVDAILRQALEHCTKKMDQPARIKTRASPRMARRQEMPA